MEVFEDGNGNASVNVTTFILKTEPDRKLNVAARFKLVTGRVRASGVSSVPLLCCF